VEGELPGPEALVLLSGSTFGSPPPPDAVASGATPLDGSTDGLTALESGCGPTLLAVGGARGPLALGGPPTLLVGALGPPTVGTSGVAMLEVALPDRSGAKALCP
jgi:hypothetical protein